MLNKNKVGRVPIGFCRQLEMCSPHCRTEFKKYDRRLYFKYLEALLKQRQLPPEGAASVSQQAPFERIIWECSAKFSHLSADGTSAATVWVQQISTRLLRMSSTRRRSHAAESSN